MDAYLLLKFVHVLLAILAVGYNFSYGVWRALARGDRERVRFALAGIQRLDRIANAGYGLLLVTGLAMVFLHNIPIRTFWVETSISLWILVAVVGMAVYARVARRQRALLDSTGPDDPAYRAADARSTQLGIGVTILVVIIVFLMVVKPTP
ncbi:MAG: DUF2269 family protein [Chloroflexota bacterium]|nr:DUF2269 family protein [Chloroflexota bacterium]MDE3192705.1 DUF2269 family protein [Chloroflexota bacterium]